MEKELGFSRSDIRDKLKEDGYLILPKGMEVDLTLLFADPKSNTAILPNNKSFFESTSPRVDELPGIILEDEILVNHIVGYARDEQKDTYEFLLTNANILRLEEEQLELERFILNQFDFSNYQEAEYPENLGDIDMFAFTHDNSEEGQTIQGMLEAFGDRISPLYNSLNKRFVQSLHIDTGSIEDLDFLTVTVRI